MNIVKYKVWTSLTQPIMLKGISLEYGGFLLVSFLVVNTLTMNSFYVSVPYAIAAYFFGLLKSKQDKNWFRVVLICLVFYGQKPFRRWRYEC
jgi:type IV secretory pathway VirB3-like protein